MARTPLAGKLQEISRRQFLKGAGATAVAAAAWSPRAWGAPAPPPTGSVVVVGAGLAGLICTYRLQQSGVNATLYEAHASRVGGRCWSFEFAPGIVAEHGGELIDSGHLEVKHLAQELGFPLDNLLQAEVAGTDPFHYFDGAAYSEAQAESDFNAVYQKLHKDVSAASYPTTYHSSTQRGRELDSMSIIDWINESVPGGIKSKFGQLLDIAYNIEYGGECSDQSALNLIYLLGYSGQGRLRIFGPSNEKLHVRGGNDQMALELGRRVAGQTTMGSELVAVKRTATGRSTLTFTQGATTRTVTADRVVYALPFSILRSSVDLSAAGFGPYKMRAIRELGMGTNSKLHVGFKSRLWETLGCNGETYADTGYQNSWDVSRAQPRPGGVLVNYTGGKVGASFGSGTPASRAKQFLGQIEPVLPGITAQWDSRAVVDYWAGYPWTKGSYSYFRRGQYQAFAGAEAEMDGASHFCGEHTSQDFQGYLNGAVESGERAASEVLAALR